MNHKLVQVARAQHRYVVGPQRRGLAEILKLTGVSVEVPPEEEDSDTITLRGDPTKLGDALAMVYAKASSVITAEITCESWMHKFLIGPKGATLEVSVSIDMLIFHPVLLNDFFGHVFFFFSLFLCCFW